MPSAVIKCLVCVSASPFTVCAGAFIWCGDLDRNILGYVLAAASCVLQALYLSCGSGHDQLAAGRRGSSTTRHCVHCLC